ncbi:hypothetical protein GAP32_517 [Cronobacter phage vB_CsaM_GAP32]|uniref:Uncharacterized protein n=1 Tax=Cronobacter phage vB_CsaM_GAP32 TaxID=1141136 RepID=K4F7U9_9CAUD|nr:hypothetical protein GAP32_517 [Cronobacter phage vB_CsaM_GAP32]AFC21977.1 hypothetical protein GAP32_517 [Cronobacter phage vB_CsaM_GAP32]
MTHIVYNTLFNSLNKPLVNITVEDEALQYALETNSAIGGMAPFVFSKLLLKDKNPSIVEHGKGLCITIPGDNKKYKCIIYSNESGSLNDTKMRSKLINQGFHKLNIDGDTSSLSPIKDGDVFLIAHYTSKDKNLKYAGEFSVESILKVVDKK